MSRRGAGRSRFRCRRRLRRAGSPQQHGHDGKRGMARHDPRFAPADLVGDRPHEGNRQRHERARGGVQVADQRLPAHGIADHDVAEVREEDVDDDHDVQRVPRALPERPAVIADRFRGRRAGQGKRWIVRPWCSFLGGWEFAGASVPPLKCVDITFVPVGEPDMSAMCLFRRRHILASRDAGLRLRRRANRHRNSETVH